MNTEEMQNQPPEQPYSLSESDLKVWILRALQSNDFSPQQTSYDLSAGVQLQRIFDSGSLEFQEKFKSSLVRAIVEWRPRAHGHSLLRNLAVLAAYVRASSALRFLGQAMFSDRIKSRRSDEEFCVAETVIAVLAGFAASEESRTILETLFFSKKVDYRFAGQMLNGLCACSPEHYPRYLTRFFSLYDRNPGYFREDLLFAQFFRIISPATLARHFASLEMGVKNRLLKLIQASKEADFALLSHPENGFILVTAEFTGFPLAASGKPNLQTLKAAFKTKEDGILNHPQGTKGWLRDIIN